MTFLIRVPLYLLVLVSTLAVAGHYIGAGVCSLLLFLEIFANRERRSLANVAAIWRLFKVPLVASLLYLGWLVVSTYMNPANPAPTNFNAVAGHLYWCLLPPVVLLAQPPLTETDWRYLLVALAIATGVLGLFAASQAIWGWQLVGVHFAPGDTRAQGLYSHPLSFAYMCLLPFPLGCAAICRWPRSLAAWTVTLSMLVAIVASRSRTVEVVAALVIFWNIATATRGRARVVLLGTTFTVLAGVLLTPNPVGVKFRRMFDRYDVRSDYADDRLAFWHANYDMWAERPWLGHGENLDEAYRQPYYAAIGLADFERKYPAHNMYLQLAVNGGLIGLALVMVWLGWQLWAAYRFGPGTFAGGATLQVLIAFGAAAITQNAFQDSVVRYGLTLTVTALWLRVRDAAAPQSG